MQLLIENMISQKLAQPAQVEHQMQVDWQGLLPDAIVFCG